MSDGKFALIVNIALCLVILGVGKYIENNRNEIKTIKAENLEILKTQKFILNSLLKSKKAEIELLYFQNKMLNKIDSLKIKE